eukprot:jgi/Hompol1/4196/HPOL_001752-RA
MRAFLGGVSTTQTETITVTEAVEDVAETAEIQVIPPPASTSATNDIAAAIAAMKQQQQQNDTPSYGRPSSSLSQRSSRSAVPLGAPITRSADHGPVVATSQIVAPVRAVNPIVDEILHALNLIQDDDESMTVFDIKDCDCFTTTHAAALADGLRGNTNLKTIILHNARLQTQAAVDIAKALVENSSVLVLDLSSNSIGPAGMRALADMLESNSTLIELRLENQKSITQTGIDAEQAFARALNKNHTLQKLGLVFRTVSARDQVDRAITRNKEAARKARLTASSNDA